MEMEVDQPQVHVKGETERLELSEEALTALEVFQSSIGIKARSGEFSYTVFGVVNKCRTNAGKKLLADWLKHPLFDVERLNQRLDVVEAFDGAANCRELLHKSLLPQIPEVEKLADKLGTPKASLEHCYRLGRACATLNSINEVLAEVNETPAVQQLISIPLQKSANELEKFGELVEQTIEFVKETGEYRVRPSLAEDLGDLDEQMDALERKAERILSDLKSEVDCDNLKKEKDPEIGYVFRVTLKSEKAIRAQKFTVISTNKQGVKFTTPALEKLNTPYNDLQEQYAEMQKQLTSGIIESSVGYIPSFKDMEKRIAVLDVLCGFSVMSATSVAAFVRPQLEEPGTRVMDLRDCRHPILEAAPDAPSFIPNDVKFDGDHFCVLTGANMGGKSTYLRSAAISVLLGQIGCFVPCASARFSLVDGIYTRVGAEDVQGKGISTFMREMIDCKAILDHATANSLVIIDELGRGTSTFDGFGLAYAIAEEIIARGCFALFATHFHEMAVLKQTYPQQVQNQKVEVYAAESGQMTILYKIAEGVAEKSFGLQIARMVGFPDEVVQDAEETLNRLEKSGASARDKKAREVLRSLQQMNAEEIRHSLLNFVPEELN